MSPAGTNGWLAPAPANLFATNSPALVSGLTNWADRSGCGYPLQGAAHSRAIRFSGGASNVFGATAAQPLCVDFLVSPQAWTDAAPPAIRAGMLFAFYVSSGGHLVVARSSDVGPDASNVWTEIPEVTISANDWARATVTLVCGADAAFYSLRVDGQGPVLHAQALAQPDETAPAGGPWFACANFRSRIAASTFSLSGAGFLDDWVVTNAMPSFAPAPAPTALITPVCDSAGGAIAPGTTVEVPVGVSTSFTIQADPYFHVVGVQTNGGAVLDHDFLGSPTNRYVFTWPSVPAGMHVLSGAFGPDLAARGTPVPWLARYYVTNDFDGAAESDTDGDRLPAWAEYLAGTDPTNGGSVFAIENVGVSAGSNYVIWTAGGDPALPPFVIRRSASLGDGVWEPAGMLWRQPLAETNVWFDPLPTSPAFYRITITN